MECLRKMSKSIYEEALEAYHHIKAIVLNKKSHLTWMEENHHLANITRALQQAQKQEKLLALYKEITKIMKELKILEDAIVGYERYLSLKKQLKEIEKQIKELENE